jgi:hypothetical protein
MPKGKLLQILYFCMRLLMGYLDLHIRAWVEGHTQL